MTPDNAARTEPDNDDLQKNPDGSVTVKRDGYYSIQQRPDGTWTLAPATP